ncbi:HAD-IA family hydrolase [Novosphingobium sp. ZN18A2]|uniref:HAD-IA family hydrolase n=1 Tax=Novosphingobium sp. ZN18A2 TaxID=3079861 RepID=UPI0030D3E89C
MHRPALLFDLDGTLVDSAHGIAVALTRQLRARGGDAIEIARVRSLVSLGVDTLVREALGSHFRNADEDVSEFRAALTTIAADPASIFPGVIAALSELARYGYPMAIVTNKPERLARQLIAQLDLERFFPAVVGGDTLAVCKPDPAPLLHARQLLTEGDGAIMIGDSKVDAHAAAAAASPFLLYQAGYGKDECAFVASEHRFTDFGELPALIARHAG